MDSDSPIDNDPPIDTAAYRARFAHAVVPRDDYFVYTDRLIDEDDYWFNLQLNEDATINFHPVDDAGNRGAIFYFDTVYFPQPV